MNKRISNRDEALSRRIFLKSAVAGGAALAGSGAVIEFADAGDAIDAPREPLEKIVERCGSELGDVRSVRSTTTN